MPPWIFVQYYRCSVLRLLPATPVRATVGAARHPRLPPRAATGDHGDRVLSPERRFLAYTFPSRSPRPQLRPETQFRAVQGGVLCHAKKLPTSKPHRRQPAGRRRTLPRRGRQARRQLRGDRAEARAQGVPQVSVTFHIDASGPFRLPPPTRPPGRRWQCPHGLTTHDAVCTTAKKQPAHAPVTARRPSRFPAELPGACRRASADRALRARRPRASAHRSNQSRTACRTARCQSARARCRASLP